MSARSRLLLDLGLFAGLLVANNPAWTGIAVHEWIALAIVVPLLVHLVVNWEWTVRVAMTFVDRVKNASRVNLAVDALLFVATVAVMLSGFMVSTAIAGLFGIAGAKSLMWVTMHAWSADATFILLLVHTVLHAKFFARVVGQWLATPIGQPARTVPAAAQLPREEYR